MPDVSYLISYRKTSDRRHANLQYILDALVHFSAFEIEIILVEQDQNQRCDPQTLPGNCHYIFVCNNGSFNKSWGFNLAAREATSSYLIMADADILLSQDSLMEIHRQFMRGADAINPYTRLIDLDETETQKLLTGRRSLSIERSEQHLNRLDRRQELPYCGGVFALTRDLLDKTGGLDERFEGWGAEDNAMSMRLAYFTNNCITLNGHTAYHLWHEPAIELVDNDPRYLRNLALLSAYYEYGEQFYADLALADQAHNAHKDKYLETRIIDSNLRLSARVSCLCVTRNRPDALKQAISCFESQTHSNKELLIVCEDDDAETLRFVRTLSVPNIHVHIIDSEPKLTLGELRNRATALANGKYVCQWDDDDWYHPRRLELQLKSAVVSGKAASILPRWLIYSRANQLAYCSNVRLWEGSLLCDRSVLLAGPGYPPQSRGEDTSLVSWLYIRDQLAIEDRPDLYVYIHSGNNTWDDQHFQKILKSSTPLNASDTAHLLKLLGNPPFLGDFQSRKLSHHS